MHHHHNTETFVPVYVHDLSLEQQKEVLSNLNPLKKRDGKIKGCSCMDGRLQQNIFKQEVANITDWEHLPDSNNQHSQGARCCHYWSVRSVPTHKHRSIGWDYIYGFEGQACWIDGACKPKTILKNINTGKGKKVLYVWLRKAVTGPLSILLLCYSLQHFPSMGVPIGALFPRSQLDPTNRSLEKVRSEELVWQN